MKPRIKMNRYDNWNGYLGNRRVIEFGNSKEATAEQQAEAWLKEQESKRAKVVPEVIDTPAQFTEHYYVTVRDGIRTGFLLGPYTTHEEALSNVDRGRDESVNADARAWFYAYGTAKVTGEPPKTVFGK